MIGYGLDRPINEQDREAVMKALLAVKFPPVTTGTSSHSRCEVKVFTHKQIVAIIQQAMVDSQCYERFK